MPNFDRLLRIRVPVVGAEPYGRGGIPDGLCRNHHPAVFLMLAAKIVFRGILISALLLILAALCPPLVILPALWGALSFVLKFWRLCRNIPLILGGLVLYGLVYFVPCAGRALLPAALPWWIHATLIVAGLGLSTLAGFWLIKTCIAGFYQLGYSQEHAAAVLLGFSTYLIIFLLTFLIPGMDGDSGGDGSFGHED